MSLSHLFPVQRKPLLSHTQLSSHTYKKVLSVHLWKPFKVLFSNSKGNGAEWNKNIISSFGLWKFITHTRTLTTTLSKLGSPSVQKRERKEELKLKFIMKIC
jgi:hypothetical protein